MREQLLHDVNHSNPETLELFYNIKTIVFTTIKHPNELFRNRDEQIVLFLQGKRYLLDISKLKFMKQHGLIYAGGGIVKYFARRHAFIRYLSQRFASVWQAKSRLCTPAIFIA